MPGSVNLRASLGYLPKTNVGFVREKSFLFLNLPLDKSHFITEVRRKSSHPDDKHIFMVSAKKSDCTYTVWTSWNDAVQNLNHGHYDLQSIEECEKIFEEFYYKG